MKYIDAENRYWTCELCGADLWPNILDGVWIHDGNPSCPAVNVRCGMNEYNRTIAHVELVPPEVLSLCTGECR